MGVGRSLALFKADRWTRSIPHGLFLLTPNGILLVADSACPAFVVQKHNFINSFGGGIKMTSFKYFSKFVAFGLFRPKWSVTRAVEKIKQGATPIALVFLLFGSFAYGQDTTHCYVSRAKDWQWSSFHRYVKFGYYPNDWGERDKRPLFDGGSFGE